jgi:predicted O-linked N-acetylglucosamine transferase (SPINDLY family)
VLYVPDREPMNHHVLHQFLAHGISGERISFITRQPRLEYLRRHHDIDIALDPFPYNGHMTSCDALYMGVPVVSLRGNTSVARGGASLLASLQLIELLASSPDEYVRIATHLAGDLPRLAELRRTLRTRMKKSPLMDGVGFVRDLENLYRQMWTSAPRA